MPAPIQAILFDLDGVITDSAEYHYQSWQEMADAQGLTFDRTLNEQLRGVSRRESLDIILRESSREVEEATALAWMESKNTRYREMLQTVTREDLLPGVENLLNELRQSDLKIAVASGSRNTPLVLDKLGISDWFDAIVAGPDPEAAPGHRRPKPAPDLFLRGAAALGVLARPVHRRRGCGLRHRRRAGGGHGHRGDWPGRAGGPRRSGVAQS